MSQHPAFLYQFEAMRPKLVTDPGAWTPEDERTTVAHFAYLKWATADGVVLLTGGSLDGKGPAIVILEAASEEEVRCLMERDPFVASGPMRATLHPFRPALVREGRPPEH